MNFVATDVYTEQYNNNCLFHSKIVSCFILKLWRFRLCWQHARFKEFEQSAELIASRHFSARSVSEECQEFAQVNVK